jgi:hypothetical protein
MALAARRQVLAVGCATRWLSARSFRSTMVGAGARAVRRGART